MGNETPLLPPFTGTTAPRLPSAGSLSPVTPFPTVVPPSTGLRQGPAPLGRPHTGVGETSSWKTTKPLDVRGLLPDFPCTYTVSLWSFSFFLSRDF